MIDRAKIFASASGDGVYLIFLRYVPFDTVSI